MTGGLYDLAVNNYAWRDERGELYYYSLPYKTGYDVYIQRKDDEPLTGLQDIADRGYKIEVGAGSNILSIQSLIFRLSSKISQMVRQM